MQKKVVVGLDFDGVVAYNPVRVMRAPVAWVKRRILGKTETSFFVPKGRWQKLAWTLIHKASYFPAPGLELLKQMAKRQDFEFHLVTARYDFLRGDLDAWLRKHKLESVFTTVSSNLNNEQPHLYKEQAVRQLGLSYFVEDNLDIVEYIQKKGITKVLWIKNIIDGWKNRGVGFRNLGEALDAISRDE